MSDPRSEFPKNWLWMDKEGTFQEVFVKLEKLETIKTAVLYSFVRGETRQAIIL